MTSGRGNEPECPNAGGINETLIESQVKINVESSHFSPRLSNQEVNQTADAINYFKIQPGDTSNTIRLE